MERVVCVYQQNIILRCIIVYKRVLSIEKLSFGWKVRSGILTIIKLTILYTSASGLKLVGILTSCTMP